MKVTPIVNMIPNPVIILSRTEITAFNPNIVLEWTLFFCQKVAHVKRLIITNTIGMSGASCMI